MLHETSLLQNILGIFWKRVSVVVCRFWRNVWDDDRFLCPRCKCVPNETPMQLTWRHTTLTTATSLLPLLSTPLVNGSKGTVAEWRGSGLVLYLFVNPGRKAIYRKTTYHEAETLVTIWKWNKFQWNILCVYWLHDGALSSKGLAQER